MTSRPSCGRFPRSVRGIFTPALMGLGRSYIGTRAPGPLPRGCLALPTRVYYHISAKKAIPFLNFFKKTFVHTTCRNGPARFNTLKYESEIIKKKTRWRGGRLSAVGPHVPCPHRVAGLGSLSALSGAFPNPPLPSRFGTLPLGDPSGSGSQFPSEPPP